jgi:alpha-tubulin suppressor-like RCC1 family protein
MSGELGAGTDVEIGPIGVTGLSSGVSVITAGPYNSCAIVNGGAKCWGDNTYGQLGNGTTTQSTTPVAVTGLDSGVTAISIGFYHACAVVDGGAQCWGNLNSTRELIPVAIAGLISGVTAISAGGGMIPGNVTPEYTCAIVNGAEQCWGDDRYGQLGDGRFLSAETPQAVVQGDVIFKDGFDVN